MGVALRGGAFFGRIELLIGADWTRVTVVANIFVHPFGVVTPCVKCSISVVPLAFRVMKALVVTTNSIGVRSIPGSSFFGRAAGRTNDKSWSCGDVASFCPSFSAFCGEVGRAQSAAMVFGVGKPV
ncbi:hypothetical protein ACWEIJ_24695 [Lentzea sp. NPDC004789]